MHDTLRIAVLMTVHNRVSKTLACLHGLHAQRCNTPAFDLEVFLVDDGSTDSTWHEVENSFPLVNLIKGDGTLYWNQGMRLAWETARTSGNFDFYLWLNNDTLLEPHALDTLLSVQRLQKEKAGKYGIAIGACKGENSLGKLVTTYGGRDAKGMIEPCDEPRTANAMNGNCVLVSHECVNTIGILSPSFRHHFGDMVYALTANKHNIPVWVAPGYLAQCDRNEIPTWKNPSKTLAQRWRAFHGPKGIHPSEIRAYIRAEGRRLWITNYLKNLFLVFFPKCRRVK